MKIVNFDKNIKYENLVHIEDIKNVKERKITLEISFDSLNLGCSIYGKNKKETKIIQRKNAKIVVKVYKQITKTIKFAKFHKILLNDKIVIKNLDKKQNNNDYMLNIMLEVKYNTPIHKKLFKTIDLACDYLDKENFDNNMCDFKDNKCAKHRARGFARCTGCCPAKCKFQHDCPCTTKNISCKFILCDYLEKMGYYLSPLTLPIFIVNLTFAQRLVSFGLFFKSQNRTVRIIRFIKYLEIFLILLILFVISFNIYFAIK